MSEFDKMINFLDTAWCAKKYIVPCLAGPVGIGKTAAVYQHAANVNAGKVVMIIASQILPNEVSGITMPVHESKAMEIYDHYRLSSLKDGDILFFDELLEADQLVLSACLTLIESRQLMSGRQLPDIQVIAATNTTIKPQMLKENIRQRFVWQEFKIDRYGCREYIKEAYGFDVGNDVAQLVVGTGNEYNILTQRSLTKMCEWMTESKGDKYKAAAIADQINCIWECQLGTYIKDAYMDAFSSPIKQVQLALQNLVVSAGIDDQKINDIIGGDFQDTDLLEVIGLLKELPEWSSLEESLSNMMIEQQEDEIKF